MKTKAVAEVVAVAFIILAGALVAFLPGQVRIGVPSSILTICGWREGGRDDTTFTDSAFRL